MSIQQNTHGIDSKLFDVLKRQEAFLLFDIERTKIESAYTAVAHAWAEVMLRITRLKLEGKPDDNQLYTDAQGLVETMEAHNKAYQQLEEELLRTWYPYDVEFTGMVSKSMSNHLN